MRVGFYLENRNYLGVNFSSPKDGNPGIGGTQYIIWTVSCYLNHIYKDIDVIIFAPLQDTLPDNVMKIKANSLNEAVCFSEKIQVDIFVFNSYDGDKDTFKIIEEKKIKSIMWSHNYENYDLLKWASECNYLMRNICVGKEQYDRLRDHKIFKKSDYIFNCLDFSLYDGYKKNINEKENIVSYMGSLIENKGFHVLAKSWKEVLKEVPDAKLYVIGNGSLYDKNAKLGKYKLASEEYENKFIKYIVDENNEIIKSVKFLGVIGGVEKLEIMSRCKVGVANPTAVDETFCITAIEFQALGVPVISKKSNGLLDTVANKKSGILIKKENELSQSIIELLKDNKKNEAYSEYGEKFVREKFSIYKICEKWNKVLYEVMNGQDVEPEFKAKNYFNNSKWIREINRNITKLFKNNYSLIEWREKLR